MECYIKCLGHDPAVMESAVYMHATKKRGTKNRGTADLNHYAYNPPYLIYMLIFCVKQLRFEFGTGLPRILIGTTALDFKLLSVRSSAAGKRSGSPSFSFSSSANLPPRAKGRNGSAPTGSPMDSIFPRAMQACVVRDNIRCIIIGFISIPAGCCFPDEE